MSEELRRRRKNKGFSQDQFAKILGISRQSLHSLETGRCRPSLNLLAKIERFFNSSWRDLFPEVAAQYPLSQKKENKQTKKEGFMRKNDFFNDFFNFSFPDFNDFFTFSWPEVWKKMNSVVRVSLADEGDYLKLVADLPGFKKDEVEIEIRPREVLIKAERKEKEERKRKDVFCQEVMSSQVSRRVVLPVEVDSSKAKAELRDGRLEVVLPKSGFEKSKTIKPD